MNVKYIIEKFDFLRKAKYKVRKTERNGDTEIYFSKGNISIEVTRCLCTAGDYRANVVISRNGKRENILTCCLLGEESLENLRKTITEHAESCTEQLQNYADFIQDNMANLSV